MKNNKNNFFKEYKRSEKDGLNFFKAIENTHIEALQNPDIPHVIGRLSGCGAIFKVSSSKALMIKTKLGSYNSINCGNNCK